MEKAIDKIGWKAQWRIDKFRDPEDTVAKALRAGMPMQEAISLYAKAFICTEAFEANLALNEGLQELIDIICGLGTPTKWDNSNARLGVGDSNAAENVAVVITPRLTPKFTLDCPIIYHCSLTLENLKSNG